MNALKAAHRLIESDPYEADAKVVAGLVVALASEKPYRLADLYDLGLDNFQLAMSILEEWRLGRFYARKAKLLDLAFQATGLPLPEAQETAP